MDLEDAPPSRPPPPPPNKRLSRPKITLQIPTSPAPRGPPTNLIYHDRRFQGIPPITPLSHTSGPHGNDYFHPFVQVSDKASHFMFKQFKGFKDFTMNTAKSGLSVGEKTAFWAYNKLRIWSKRWFTHFFLVLCLVLYSVMGAAIFMALEGPNEEKYDKNLTDVRKEFATRIEQIWRNDSLVKDRNFDFYKLIQSDFAEYESNYTTFSKHVNDNNTEKKTWSFWNAMFYAGTIYTTIVGMSEEGNEQRNTRPIPIIRAESETQTLGRYVSKSPDIPKNFTMEEQKMSLRKRRNLSKNRAQATRQREKTPEPGRTPVPHEDTTTSDDEDIKPSRNSREIEADVTYEEMRRLVLEQSNVKDPVYDINTDEVMEARAMAATERRRRSVSPFALPEKELEGLRQLERKGSFTDPTNKLLSTTYTLSHKDEDRSRRNSLTIDPPKDRKNSLSPPISPTSASPTEKFPFMLPPGTPKKLEEMVYPDEIVQKQSHEKTIKHKTSEEEAKPLPKPVTSKIPELPTPAPGEIVTKVIQIERTPSRKLSSDNKPVVEVRERIVRTPSRKLNSEMKPLVKQQPKPAKEEPQSKAPVKPARSKSATRFGTKTSESEMSEDLNQQSATRRKVIPTPRRFMRNRSPRANRSQSVARVEDLKVVDNTGAPITKHAQDIINKIQNRARSLSIPKDDPRIPTEYKKHRILQTPNKTPVSRTSRGISCPKTIQIISDKEILSGLAVVHRKIKNVEPENHHSSRNKHGSGYIDASQSEYTSSCYSSSPSENEYEFNLSERTAELTRKLKLLSQEVEQQINNNNILKHDFINNENNKTGLRKRIVASETKNGVKKEIKESTVVRGTEKPKIEVIKSKSRWKLIVNWQQFKQEHKESYVSIISLRNRCFCDFLLLIIMCGLGGMMFKSLEGSFENAYKCGTRNVKRDFIESLWRGSHYLREEDWKSLARKKLYEFEDQLHTAHEAGVTSYSGQRSWNFMNSFVYCLTLITTIGYGHIAPKTTYGRVATIVYAVVGIPLFLIVLADFGKLFTRIIKYFWAFIRRFYYTRSCKKVRKTGPVQEVMKGLNIVYDVVRRPSQMFNEEDMHGIGEIPPPPRDRKPSDAPPPLPPKPGQFKIEFDDDNGTEPETPAFTNFDQIDDEFNLPISLAIFILVVYIIIGAVGYNLWEQWNFFESFYFVFISMSTIGLGDLVPDHPMFMMASILYLVFGLALTSMCINVVQLKLSDTFKKASAKLGATIGLKVSEEDGSLVAITQTPTEIAPIHKPKCEKDDVNIDENDSKNR